MARTVAQTSAALDWEQWFAPARRQIELAPSRFRAERNARALARLERSMPEVFPACVVAHALARPFIPPTPRRAVESYWRAHPLRADYLARTLAARSGAPPGWSWRLDARKRNGLPASFRAPPAPYREKAFALGPGHCCICGQPVFRFGWHIDLWRDGRVNRKANWHAGCVAAWKLWTAPGQHDRLLRRRQQRRCGETGARLLKSAEVDHRTPLFRVWREHRERPWPELLGFWGTVNLQVVNRPAHVAKCALEAGERSVLSRVREDLLPCHSGAEHQRETRNPRPGASSIARLPPSRGFRGPEFIIGPAEGRTRWALPEIEALTRLSSKRERGS